MQSVCKRPAGLPHVCAGASVSKNKRNGINQNTKNNCDPTDAWACHSRGLRRKCFYLLRGEIGLNLKLTNDMNTKYLLVLVNVG